MENLIENSDFFLKGVCGGNQHILESILEFPEQFSVVSVASGP